MLLMWSALGADAAYGVFLSSETCLFITQSGSFETPDWEWSDTQLDSWNHFRHEDIRSFMILSQVGMYEGADAIREYTEFLSSNNIFLESSSLMYPRSGVGVL